MQEFMVFPPCTLPRGRVASEEKVKEWGEEKGKRTKIRQKKGERMGNTKK